MWMGRTTGRWLTRLLQLVRLRYRAGLKTSTSVCTGTEHQLMRRPTVMAEDQDLILTALRQWARAFASMFGQQACIHGYTVCYWPASKLFEQMKLCKADGTYLRELAKISKKRLLIVDDFGLEVLDTASRLILLEILEDRHGRSSSVFSSQLPVSQWHQVIGDPTIADAICDRIVHTAHRIELKGESVRKLYAHRGKESKKGPA
jgi:hypothetical protein